MLLHISLDLLRITSIFKAEYGGSKFQEAPKRLFVPHILLHTYFMCKLSYYYYCIICKVLRLCRDP